MGQIVPDAVEQYLAGLNRAPDALLREIAASGAAERLPLVDAEVGAFLRLLATAIGAPRILEIGTAIGYSGIWLAGALPPGGMLLTMEVDAGRAQAARHNFTRAGLADRVNVIVGDARRMLHKMAWPFDLVFLDSGKDLYVAALERLVELLRPGGLLVADNVLWSGDVVPGFQQAPVHDEASIRAVAEFNERICAHPALLTSVIPLRDGVSVSVKRA